jgi:hypothetical protein
MGDFWDSNLGILRGCYPGLAEQILKDVPSGFDEADIQIETCASGEPGLKVKGVYVHSPRDPVREARRMAEGLNPGGEAAGDGPVIILGFGLGYGAEAAAEKAGGRVLVIVEKHPELLKKALACRDLGPFLKNNRLIFIPGASGDAVVSALALLEQAASKSLSQPAILKNRSLINLDEDWYAETEAKIRAWASRSQVNSATLRRFGKRWVKNLSKNRDKIYRYPGISCLEGILGGEHPVFLAAAGPSLDKTAPLLGELQERCVIIAVDTSLRFLLRQGIKPDFTMVVDPQFWNARHLDRCAAPETCLVTESAVYPSVLNHPFKRTFLCGSHYPLGLYLEDRIEAKGRLGAGGSVATTAWDFARCLGASSVWIAGLDLAFPGLKTHFKGARFEEKSLSESHRLDPAETWSVRGLLDGAPFRAPAADGGETLTDKRLSLYAAWFESRFRQFPRIRNYRLFPEGLAIRGLENGGIDELLALPKLRPRIDALLEEAYTKTEADFYTPQKTLDRRERFEKARRELLSGLGELKNTACKGRQLAEDALRKLNHAGTTEQEKLLDAFGAINRQIQGSKVKEVAGFLFPDTAELEKKLTSPLAKPFERHLEFSLLLYRSLEDAAVYHIEELKR